MAHKVIILKPDTLPLTSVRRDTPKFEKSLDEIKTLLRKFSCGQLNLHEDYRGDEPLFTLRFEHRGQLYLIEMPVTYLQKATGNALEMRISGRVVYHYLKSLLLAVELDYKSFAQAMRSYAALPDPEDPRGREITFEEYTDRHAHLFPRGEFDIRMALPAAALTEGWAPAHDSPRYHYYRDGRSLCGQSDRRGGPVQAELPDSTPFGDPACPQCREMLMHDRKGGAEDGLV